MAKPLDFTKLHKDYSKKRGIKSGFNDPITWIDTGNKALNKMVSGRFDAGIPLGAVTIVAGESGSGKSVLVSGNIVRNALAQGINVVVVDTEDALKTKWVSDLGVDPDHPNLVKFVLNTINEIAQMIGDFTDGYREEYKNVPREDQPKMLFVIDSLGFLESETEIEQFQKGALKGDKGIKAKMLKMLVGNCIRLFAGYEIGLIATNHVYKSQDQYKPDDIISGGGGVIFAASIIVSMNKKKLKESTEAGAPVLGIIAKTKCVKTRYSKPFEEVDVNIPYETGMDPYSGLFDMFEAKGLLTKVGNRYRYVDRDGVEHVHFRKNMGPEFFEMIIREYDDSSTPTGVGVVVDIENKELEE